MAERARAGKPIGGVGVMAARAGGGQWEVVKKNRRPGAGGQRRGGGGDRRALGEANGVRKYDLTRESPNSQPAPGLPGAPPGSRGWRSDTPRPLQARSHTHPLWVRVAPAS